MDSARVRHLPNSLHVVETAAGQVLVNCPPETLKFLISAGLKAARIILLPPDMPSGRQLGSLGFVRQGVNYASVEFLLYANFFGGGGLRTKLITPTADQAKRLRRLLDETIAGPLNESDYAQAPWLQKECAAVGYYPPLGRVPTTDDLAEIYSLDQGGGDLGSGVQVRLDGEDFVFTENGQMVAAVSTEILGTPAPHSMAPPRPLQRQELTLQFIGASDGFDPQGVTTCFLAYLSPTVMTQATLFDTAAYLRLRLGNLGIATNQISEVVLSHLHEDHLAGLPELILMGETRVRLVTSDIICAGLLRVLSAMLGIPESEVANLFDYFPLNPGQPLELDGRRFESIYAIHTIPTLAVRAEGLCYSGDMRYDEEWFAELEQRGVLSPARRHELTHFFDGAKVLVQDVGGGAIHTRLTPDLLKSLVAKSQRLVLAHTSRHDLPTDDPEVAAAVEFAETGHVTALGDRRYMSDEMERVETISACPLFARLPVDERIHLAHHTYLAAWAPDQVIMREGDEQDGNLYVVHSGLVEIQVGGKQVTMMGRGASVGERGVLRGENRTATLIARGPVQLLALKTDDFLPVAQSLGLLPASVRADWLMRHPAFTHLMPSAILDFALDFEPRQLDEGEKLFEYGEPGYEVYLLIAGAIRLLDQNGQATDELATPGEFLGARAALYGWPRNATAIAAQPTEVWALPAAALERLRIMYPNILLHLKMMEAGR